MVLKIQREVTLGPDGRSTRLQGLLWIEDERQLFVVDLDELERLLGHVPVDRGHSGHGLADEAHGVVEHVPNVFSDILGRVVVLPPPRYGARAVDQLVCLVRDDRPHARQGLGLRYVDTADTRVWVGAPQDPCVQHPGEPNVAGIGGSPRHALIGIDARDVVPDRVHGPHLLARSP